MARVLARGRKSPGPRPPRKAASEILLCTYRKPTPVGRGNPPQVNERTSVKELGNMTPYLRKKGYPSSFHSLRAGVRGSQQIGSSDCLPKTQVSANTKVEV